MNIELGPESHRRRWSPEKAPRFNSSVEDMDIEDVEHTIQIALEDPDRLSQGDREVLEYWLPILADKWAE